MSILTALKGISPEEKFYVKRVIENLEDEDVELFLIKYSIKRRNRYVYVLLAFLGFIGFAGLHRFYSGKIKMGLAQFFTLGFLLIGTIIDVLMSMKQCADANLEIAEILAFQIKEANPERYADKITKSTIHLS
jgi:TM2 domain-containing membrane protein YozV